MHLYMSVCMCVCNQIPYAKYSYALAIVEVSHSLHMANSSHVEF